MSTIPSYILILTPAREHIEGFLLKQYTPASSHLEMMLRNTVRAGLVLGTAFIAVKDPMFGSALGAVGGLTDAFQSFNLPSMINFLFRNNRGEPSSSSVNHKLFYSSVCGWGVTVVIYTILDVSIDMEIEFHYFIGFFLLATFLIFLSMNVIAKKL